MSTKYHKIQSVYKRDPNNNFRTFIDGDFSLSEFEYLASNKWVFTEKVDGTNIRVTIHEDRIEYGGRTDRAQIPTSLLSALQGIFEGQDTSGLVGLTFYGEGYGPKIQKAGALYRDNPSFVLFDIGSDGVYLERSSVEDIAANMGIDVVPIIGSGTLFDMVDLARSGFSSMWGNFNAEGIVARTETELMSKTGKRMITKVKLTDFQ